MKSYILQPNHVRGLGNILDNEDNIEGLYCRVQQQNTTVDFEEVIMKTYYMGTGSELTITFITDSFSILPNSTAHIDVMVTDEENNPVSGVDLYIYEDDELIAQLETGNDGFGVGDELIGFDFSSEASGRYSLKCVLPRQDTYLESVKEVAINVYEQTTLTLSIDPSEIDSLTDTVTLYGTLIGDESFGIVGQSVKFYNGDEYLGEGMTDDDGVATLVVNVSTLSDIAEETVIFEDSCSSSSGLTNYGSSIPLRSGTATIEFDGTNLCYVITNTGSQKESFIPITPLTGLTDNFTIEFDSYISGTDGSSGFVIYNDANNWYKLTDDGNNKYWVGYKVNGSFTEIPKYPGNTYQMWIHSKFTVKDGVFSVVISDFEDHSLIASYSVNLNGFTINESTRFGIDSEWQLNRKTYYRNIVVKQIA